MLFYAVISPPSYAALIGTSKKFDHKEFVGRTTLRKAKGIASESYYIYVPKDYSPSKKWPLFIGVHAYTFNGMQAIGFWRQYADPEGFILVCPNFRDGYQGLGSGSVGQMKDILIEVKKDFNIDNKKVLITGFSAGAQFAHRFIILYPEYFQAASIMAAGSYNKPSRSRAAKHIKFLVMVGEADGERFGITKRYARWLEEEGYDVKFRPFGCVGHEVSLEEKQLTIELFREMRGNKK